MATDVSQPEYWNQLYLQKDTGWDKGTAAPAIARMLAEGVIRPGGSVVSLGAGRGHEAFAAAAAGYQVTAVDFAAEAAKSMRERGAPFEVLQADLFTMRRKFDAVIEHTCFCAIEVERRDEYVQAVAEMLKPGGVLLGLFYAHGKAGGPPFDVDADELRRRFSGRFEIERLVMPGDSFPNRVGKELEAIFRLKG